MSLSLDDVRRVAQLARLRQDDVQAEAMLGELNAIFRLIGEMEAVDTAAVEPMSHPRDVAQRLRPDQVTEPDRREALLALAPRAEAGLYLVPKVIE
jgi:aspartyl-tRNA(Asn)/glutamyl-tRNA(Gln) amidotransferase subunit C